MKTNSELRDEAYKALEGHWGKAALITLVFYVISIVGGTGFGFIPKLGSIVSIALLPMTWAYYIIFLHLKRGEKIEIAQIFDGFDGNYFRYLGTMLLMSIYVVLWSLLLIVPGIMKGCSYAMTAYILQDNSNLSYNKAIDKSMIMMEGYKMKYFLMLLSFIGWAILCILTLGIGFLWLMPYISTSLAAFYEDVKADYEVKQQK